MVKTEKRRRNEGAVRGLLSKPPDDQPTSKIKKSLTTTKPKQEYIKQPSRTHTSKSQKVQ
jgi:hypothetical protein